MPTILDTSTATPAGKDVIVGKHLYANPYSIDPERGWDEEAPGGRR